jgi:hypothetical protein
MSSLLLWMLNVLRDGLPIPTNYIQLITDHARGLHSEG